MAASLEAQQQCHGCVEEKERDEKTLLAILRSAEITYKWREDGISHVSITKDDKAVYYITSNMKMFKEDLKNYSDGELSVLTKYITQGEKSEEKILKIDLASIREPALNETSLERADGMRDGGQ
ncbi:uncharacterized protein LOC117178169 [Belonocnema kinseyi]|uniref:uncharacterized protein LOC117178169 n=1 Tax=Belonocnema kinseyi TaxID=2817044 RepID=UPI00143DB55F|nr:uncharacterized protein LOC117178169 [Belonocnema kinseyi]